jgi:hypothetical protein
MIFDFPKTDIVSLKHIQPFRRRKFPFSHPKSAKGFHWKYLNSGQSNQCLSAVPERKRQICMRTTPIGYGRRIPEQRPRTEPHQKPTTSHPFRSVFAKWTVP